MRCFSIVSAPADTEVLQFGVRLGGPFTRALGELPIGTDMFVQGPFGNFVIDERYDRNIVMLAGGIGITPFISMLRALSTDPNPPPVTLVYSCRDASDRPFLEELALLQSQIPSLKIFAFITGGNPAEPLPGTIAGAISGQHIQALTTGAYTGSTYFLCGPKGFMESIGTALRTNGVSESRILTESFTQSSKLLSFGGYSISRLTYAAAAATLVMGIAGISYLDLSRYVPKHVTATVPATTQTIQTTTDSSASASTTAAASTSSQDSMRTSQMQNQSYQPPISSVS